jgi:hypothetical protein
VERGNWEVDLIDLGGSPVDYVRSNRGNYVILSFRPTQDLFIDGQIGDYVLLFQMRDGKPGVPQDLRSTVRKSDRPLGEAEIDALVSEAEAEWRLPSASRQPHRE